MSLFKPKQLDDAASGTVSVPDIGDIEVYQRGELFVEGAQFPPAHEIERLAKYERGKKIFDGKLYEVYERASQILKDTPAAAQLETLYIAVNLMDVLLTKPADLLVGNPPTYESGHSADSAEQAALDRIVEENDLNQLIHELVIGAGYRGDSFIKTYYDYRGDFSEVPGGRPPYVRPEPIIEAVNPIYVYPELSRGSAKRFKAINIAFVEWVDEGDEETPYLNVERHVPGYIFYSRYRLHPKDVDNSYGVPIQTFTVGERVPTGRDVEYEETGIPRLLIGHIPYKSTDDEWSGISGIEKLESVLAAINDRIVQIDYILWKHSDPVAYGPPLSTDDEVQWGGKYIEVRKDEPEPGYMTWNSQLEGAFRELDFLLGLVYQMSETPQWLFGTTMIEDRGGTGTSHTDGAALRMRFMPIIKKVERIRSHVDRAIRDALWTAMELEIEANRGVRDFAAYEPVYPKIIWKDPVPRDEKEEAETMNIRTGGLPTIDVKSAIKRMDGLNDEQAEVIVQAIAEDEKRAFGTVDSSVFNGGDA